MSLHPSQVLMRPVVSGVELRGRLEPRVQAKDVVLELLRRHGVRGGVGRIFEFHGDGVATLSVPERATICNMVVETGGFLVSKRVDLEIDAELHYAG